MKDLIILFLDLIIKCIFIVIKEKCFIFDLFKIKCVILIMKSLLVINDKINYNFIRIINLISKRYVSDLLKICWKVLNLIINFFDVFLNFGVCVLI